jgi:hypothetical protein
MLSALESLTSRLADYTIGTVIVMVHIALADRRNVRGLLRAS